MWGVTEFLLLFPGVCRCYVKCLLSDVPACHSCLLHVHLPPNQIGPDSFFQLTFSLSLLPFNRVPEPPVPVWAYRPDKKLCLLSRELWSSQALEALAEDKACLSGLIFPFTRQYGARAKASQVGIPVRHVRPLPTPPRASVASPGLLASFPSITIYTWQPGSAHNLQRILAICGRLLASYSADCFFLTSSSLSISSLLGLTCITFCQWAAPRSLIQRNIPKNLRLIRQRADCRILQCSRFFFFFNTDWPPGVTICD